MNCLHSTERNSDHNRAGILNYAYLDLFLGEMGL